MGHVTLVCHDAGGAEILSSWLNRSYCSASIVVAGPAEAIFRRKCPEAEFLELEASLTKSEWILCGTGWQSNFERKAISRGRALAKKTVAFLDHWVNYRERFHEDGRSVLPNEIWVGDIEAERIASSLFDTTPILLQPNPYFEDLLAEIKRKLATGIKSSSGRVLYVCEPIAEHALSQYGNSRHWGYTERDALLYFFANIRALGQPIDTITVRPHPSEPANKYYWAKGLISQQVEFGNNTSLLEEILASDIVVGCESMAMVVGLLAGKRVVSTIPPGGRACQLPHHDIESLRQLVEEYSKHG